MEGVTLGKDAAKRGDDIDHQVDPDQVIEAEHARLRNAHGAAHQRIGLFDCQLVAHGLVDPGLQREHADPVAEEARRIGAAHHALAEDTVVEIGQPVDHRLIGIGAADKLQEAHIAHRIEIMGDGEPLAERGRHILDQKADRDGRGVGADDAVRPDGGVEPRIEVLLDVEPLDNGLDDPVAFGELAKIVADRAGDDAARIALVHQLRRVRCHQPVDRHLGRRFVGALACRQVKKHHFMPGIGDLRGDAASHGAGADHGNLAESVCGHVLPLLSGRFRA